MEKESKTAVYDDDLRIEAYRFQGITQPFPNHFHEYYVIGFVENGQRALSCKNKDYVIEKGRTLLFNPGDSHACTQDDAESFDYRGFHISKTVMLDLTEEITGKQRLPIFSTNVIYDKDVYLYLRPLHEVVMEKAVHFQKEKEELLLSLISLLIQNYGNAFQDYVPECQQEIEKACEYMRQHYTEHINLEQICRHVGLGKSTLLRAFTKSKGITPYRYLEALRINEAKKLLAKGLSPAETAMRMGFSDQSHFTNYFNSFIGLAPGSYRKIFSEKNSVLTT